jgi:hypothetical protein
MPALRKYFVRAELWIVPTRAAHAFLKEGYRRRSDRSRWSQAMVKMDLIEVRRNKFLSQVVVLAAKEGNLQPGESGNKRLCDAIRTAARTGVRRLHSAQGGREQK